MNIDLSDVIAGIALLSSVMMWIYNRRFEQSVHQSQTAWQRQQEAQRQQERAEDLARLQDDNQPRIQVKVSLDVYTGTFLGAPDGYGGHQSITKNGDLIAITAQNWGKVNVHLCAPYLSLPNGETLTFSPRHLSGGDKTGGHFPSELVPGDSVTGALIAREACEELKRHRYAQSVDIVGTFEDAIGRGYYSDPFTFRLAHEYRD